MPAVSVVYSSKARKGAGSARCAADYRTIWLHNSWRTPNKLLREVVVVLLLHRLHGQVVCPPHPLGHVA